MNLGVAQFYLYLDVTDPGIKIHQKLQWEAFRIVFQVRDKENDSSMPRFLLKI